MTKIDSEYPLPPETKPGPKRLEAQDAVIAKAIADERCQTAYAKAKVYLQEYKQIANPTFNAATAKDSDLKNFANVIRAAINAAQTNQP